MSAVTQSFPNQQRRREQIEATRHYIEQNQGITIKQLTKHLAITRGLAYGRVCEFLHILSEAGLIEVYATRLYVKETKQ